MEPTPLQYQRTLPLSLWLTTDDQTMDRALQPIRSSNSAIIVGGAEARFTRADPIGLALIERWVACRNVRVLVVCGHAAETLVDAGNDGDLLMPRAPHEYPLIERIRLRTEAHLRGRSELLERLRAVQALPAISRAVRLGRLTVSALYYLSDSGMFLRYEDRDGSFIPLAGNGLFPSEVLTPRA